ncbi:MAG: hypothetical protein ACO395_03430 [Pontimonas sp.]
MKLDKGFLTARYTVEQVAHGTTHTTEVECGKKGTKTRSFESRLQSWARIYA